MSRIQAALAGRQDRLALIAYVTVGYPTLEATPRLVRSLTESGVDLIELGIPFSDPLADGPTIQAASQAALHQGVTVSRAIEAARDARALTGVPLLFMSYLNPILAFGLERFCTAAVEAGVDGLIVPDLPPRDAGDLRRAAAAVGLDLVFFVSPLSPVERIREAAQASTAFIYCLAVTGITGARAQLDPGVLPMLERVRAHTSRPVVVGFGISRPEHLRALAGKADGAIVASALLDAIARAPGDPAEAARDFVMQLRQRAPG